MADNKSCEGKVTTLQCMVCNFREVFTERQFKFVDGYSCFVCDGPVMPMVTKSGEGVINRKTISQNNKNKLDIIANIDCSDALKGLKSIQREAKKATAALKELEGVRTNMVVFDEMYSTCPKCGSTDYESTELKTLDDVIYSVKRECLDCGWES